MMPGAVKVSDHCVVPSVIPVSRDSASPIATIRPPATLLGCMPCQPHIMAGLCQFHLGCGDDPLAPSFEYHPGAILEPQL